MSLLQHHSLALFLTAITTCALGLLVFLAERVCQNAFGYRSVGVSLVAFALMAAAFHPLKLSIQRLVDRCFFRASPENFARRLERLEQEVREADKLRAVSVLAAGMAHEIKNPLTAIKTFVSYLPERGKSPSFQKKFYHIVSKEVERIDQIVRQLLSFARPASPQFHPVQVSRLIDETLAFLTTECLRRNIDVECSYESHARILGDREQLRQVLLNLFLNSLEAMEGGGKLIISTRQQSAQCIVTIEDTGCGISKEHLQRIFDPFFTTKSHGTGLGLSIVQGILADHHSTLTVASEISRGARCTITFPLANHQAECSELVLRHG